MSPGICSDINKTVSKKLTGLWKVTLFFLGWTGTYTLVAHLCLRNSLKIANRICQFSQYLGTKFGMLFKIAKLVAMAIILGKMTILISCNRSALLLPLPR